MRQCGFTLLEMLIGMTLLGLILVLLYGGLRLGTRGWDAGERLVEGSSKQRVAEDFLRRQLTQVYPMYWKKDGQDVVVFSGEPHALRFAASIPARLGVGGIHLISLEEVNVGDGAELRMRWTWPYPEKQAFEFPEDSGKALLAGGVKEVAFSYFGAESDAAEPAWHEEWRSERSYPTLIRVRVTAEDGRYWPEIVVAPVLGKAAGELSGGSRICILC